MLRRFPSLYLLAFVTVGIVLGDRLSLPVYWSLGLAVVAFGGAVWCGRRQYRASAILLLGVLFALLSTFHFRLKMNPTGANHLATVLTEPTLYRVYGQVGDWPELKSGRTEIEVTVDSLEQVDGGVLRRSIRGALMLKITDTTTALQRGDRIALSARLYPVRSRGVHGFDYGRFLNLKGVYAQAFLPTLLNVQIDRRPTIGYPAAVDGLRSWIRSALEQHLSPTASALARGFLIGETRDIPPEIYGWFRDSGTLHVLAVSGSNVALVLLFFVWVLRPFWFGPKLRTGILIVVILLFTGLSYGDPSVVRASIMAVLVLGARHLGRRVDLNNVIATTALIILLYDPAQLFDIGFQLSFVTAWGLIFAVPLITARFERYHDRRWYRWLLLPFIVVLVAQVCSTPIIAYYFDRIPTISLLANLLIVPLVSVAVLGIMVLLVAHLIWPLLGAWIGSLVNVLLVGVVRLLALVGGEQVTVFDTGGLVQGGTGQVLCLLAYVLIILAVLSISGRWARRALIWLVLIAGNIGLAVAAYHSFAPRATTIECHRVPGGVAVLARPDGGSRADLILTGLDHRAYDLGESVLRPLLSRRGVDKIDRLILLGSDYAALDDLIRMGADLEVSQWHFPVSLRASIEDILGTLELDPDRFRFEYFGGRRPDSSFHGYALSHGLVQLALAGVRIDIVDQLDGGQFRTTPEGVDTVLVIGSAWSPAADDWIRLRSSGYRQIVCARIAQSPTIAWPDRELDPDQIPPDYLIDLSRSDFHAIDLPR